MPDTLLDRAETIAEKIFEHRRFFHTHAEVGFDLPDTLAYVEKQLFAIGLQPVRCGRAGLTVCLGNPNGKTMLLRADMDALPIREETDLPFAAKNGNMHACGHDLHTAMLLGAAALLKSEESKLSGTVKLMFQPAEETLEGAKNMLESGILDNPTPDVALMLHVLTAVPYPCGTVILPAAGVGAPAADFFRIAFQGRGCHGSTPEKGIDPIVAAAHALLSLQNIHARELPASSGAALTIGNFRGGNAANVIAERAELGGTLRTFDDRERTFLRERLKSIVDNTAAAFRCTPSVEYLSGCPTLQNDAALVEAAKPILLNLLGESRLIIRDTPATSGGSEDFSYISHAVPSLMLGLAAGNTADGYTNPLHHPKARFDESALPVGAAVYAAMAIAFLG